MSDGQDHYRKLLVELRLERDRIEVTVRDIELELESAREARAAIDLLIDRYAPITEIEMGVSLNGAQNGHGSVLDVVDDQDRSDALVCGIATVDDILDCETQRECLYVIARKNDSSLDLNPAADLVIAAGKSQGMRSTVVSTLHHFMSHSDDWEWVSPSNFRLVTDRRSNESQSEHLSGQREYELNDETQGSEFAETVE